MHKNERANGFRWTVADTPVTPDLEVELLEHDLMVYRAQWSGYGAVLC